MKVFVASPSKYKISISLRDKAASVIRVKPDDIIDVSCLTGTKSNACISFSEQASIFERFVEKVNILVFASNSECI